MKSARQLGMAVAALAGLATALPSPAQQQQRTMRDAPVWYFGAGAGVAYGSLNGTDFNNVANLMNQAGIAGGGISQTLSSSTTEFGWKVFGGYRFGRYFGLEGSYASFGTMNMNYQFNQAGVQTGSGTMSYQSHSWNIAAVPRLPFENGAFLQAKVGAAFTTADNTYSLTMPGFTQSSSGSKASTNLLAGAGLGYDFPNGLTLLFEYEYYGRLGNSFSFNPTDGLTGVGRVDMNLFTLNGVVRF